MKFLHVDKIYWVYFGISFPVHEQWIQQVALTGKFTGSPNEEHYPPTKTNMLMENHHFITGDTSSNSLFFPLVILLFPRWPPSKTRARNASGAFVHKTLEMPSFHAFGHKERHWLDWKLKMMDNKIQELEIFRRFLQLFHSISSSNVSPNRKWKWM